MKYYGQSESVCKAIVERFEKGDLPAAIAPIFINRSDNVPSGSWSFMNRFVCAINGTADARGFRQWEAAGRRVKKGSKAFHILGPCLGKKTEKDESGEEKTHAVLYGFKSIPVFAIESTEISDPAKWETAGGVDLAEESRLKALPLREVAESWGLNVTSYSGRDKGYLGYYQAGSTIAIGVKNLSTWAHELVHAADDKLGALTKGPGQKQDNEIVAELGGAVLLQIIGEPVEADLGGAWDYIKSYAGTDAGKAVGLCFKFINRICGAVNLILETASNYQPAAESQAA